MMDHVGCGVFDNHEAYFFEKLGTNKLPGAIGTIKLPERQINGSSYTTNCDLNQFFAAI